MPAEPTGLEHLTPVKIKDTSATERAGFRGCRRNWFLTVVHRLSKDEPNPNFFLGNVYHLALAAYYQAQKDGRSVADREIAALDAYQDAYDEAVRVAQQQMGIAWMAAGVTPFREIGELGLEMLQNYIERERDDPLLDEVIAVEFRVNVAIRSPKGRKVGILSVQADVVGTKDGLLCVADHKTASQNVASAHLDLDDQLTAEVFSWWQASGEFPERAIYNVSMKKAPKPPKLLKSGKLSRDRGQLTTASLYRTEVIRLGLPMAEYEDHIAWLEEREASGEDALFRREAVFRTPGQMAAFERDLYQEWQDMRRVAAHPEQAYPSPDRMRCGSCPVRLICTTIQDDGDVEAVIKAGYVVADPRR